MGHRYWNDVPLCWSNSYFMANARGRRDSLKQSFSNQENIPFLYQRSNFVRVFYITNQQTYRNLEVFMCNKLDETSIINPNSFRDFVALEFLGTSHVTSSVLEFIKLNLPLNHKMRSQTYHIHCVIFIRGASQ